MSNPVADTAATVLESQEFLRERLSGDVLSSELHDAVYEVDPIVWTTLGPN